MRIVAVTEHYPATFKTYFDTQFADLLSRGHDVRILAGGRFDNALSAKVLQWRLQDRTTYYPRHPPHTGQDRRGPPCGPWRRATGSGCRVPVR